MVGTEVMRRVTGLLVVGALVSCSAGESDASGAASQAETAQPTSTVQPSEIASPAESAVARADELRPGAYADVVTNNLVLRSEPEVSDDSEIFLDQLNAPASVYVADGPVEADGYRWFLVIAFDENGSQPILNGWAAAEGKDGEVWLQPRPAPSGPDWEVLQTDAPAALSPRSSAMGSDGLLYFFGLAQGAAEAQGSAWVFDPVTLGWSELPAMPTPRTSPAVAVDGSRFYVIGGAVGSTISSDDETVVEVYDASTEQWSSAAPAPTRPTFSSEISAIARDGQVWLFATDGVFEYHADEDRWGVASDAFGIRWGVTQAPSGEMLVLEYSGELTSFDVETGSFGEAIRPPGVTRFGAALVADASGTVFLIGGSLVPGLGATCTGFRFYQGMAGVPLVESYDPESATWSTQPPLEVGLSTAAAFLTDDGIIVIGQTPGEDSEIVVQRRPAEPPIAGGDPLIAANQELESPGGCG